MPAFFGGSPSPQNTLLVMPMVGRSSIMPTKRCVGLGQSHLTNALADESLIDASCEIS